MLTESRRKKMTTLLFCRIFNHPNILPVLGACNHPPNLIVINQFMPFGSLYDVLHGETGMLDLLNVVEFAASESKL